MPDRYNNPTINALRLRLWASRQQFPAREYTEDGATLEQLEIIAAEHATAEDAEIQQAMAEYFARVEE